MQQTHSVDRRERTAHVAPDQRRLRSAIGTLSVHDRLQGAAGQELHPDADASAERVGAVDRDDVRMADPGEQTSFADQRGLVDGRAARVEQLERDLPFEARIPRAIHGSERAAPDRFADLEPQAAACARRRAPGDRAAGADRGRGDARIGTGFGGFNRPPRQRRSARAGRGCLPPCQDISVASFATARDTVMRAASALGLSTSAAISVYEQPSSIRAITASRSISSSDSSALS